MSDKIKALYQKYGEMLRYLVIGGLTTLIDIVVFALLSAAGMDVTPAKIITTVVAVAFAYVGNRYIVFQSKETGRKAVAGETVRFLLSRAGTMVLSVLMMNLLTGPVAMDKNVANILTNGVVIVLNYVLSKLLVFVKKK